MSEAPAALYDVRRIIHPRRGDRGAKGPAWRSVRTIASGPRDSTVALLHEQARSLGAGVAFEAGAWRAHVLRRAESYPTAERFLVVAPAGVADKQRPRFEQWWSQLTEPDDEARLAV